MIIYLLGVAAAIWTVVDILRQRTFKLYQKILLVLGVLVTSWVGIGVYYFVILPYGTAEKKK